MTAPRSTHPPQEGQKIMSRDEAGVWCPIETAPKDGTLIDLLYPYPRCRFIDANWDEALKCWVRYTPTWAPGEIAPLPETEWRVEMLPNMQPTHWMSLPPPPGSPPSPSKEVARYAGDDMAGWVGVILEGHMTEAGIDYATMRKVCDPMIPRLVEAFERTVALTDVATGSSSSESAASALTGLTAQAKPCQSEGGAS
jgi:hypothetical protein